MDIFIHDIQDIINDYKAPDYKSQFDRCILDISRHHRKLLQGLRGAHRLNRIRYYNATLGRNWLGLFRNCLAEIDPPIERYNHTVKPLYIHSDKTYGYGLERNCETDLLRY